MLDTSPVRRFAEQGVVFELADFLGDTAYAPTQVLKELGDISGKFPDIGTLLANKWPKPAPDVPRHVEENILILQKRFRPADRSDDQQVNLGEIAAVLIGQHHRFHLLVAEDTLAKDLARGKLLRISTPKLAAEMVALEKLDDEAGWKVWEAAAPKDKGLMRKHYNDDVSRARLDFHLEIYV